MLTENVPKELIFISAQPDDQYFTWQIEVQIHNFRKYNYADKMHVLVFYRGDTYNPDWNKLIYTYKEVKFFFYKNQGANISLYIPVLRPHILKQHFKAFPELSNKAIFYHDSDIVFTNKIDFEKLCIDDTWYLSDTVSYIGADYLKSKGEYIFEEMCRIVDVDRKLIEDNQSNSGGAQYLAKNLNFEFWEKVEEDCLKLYEYMNKCNAKDLSKRTPPTDVQSWCADMWAVLWNALKTNKVLVDPILDFSWSTSLSFEYNKRNIYHNAGVTTERKDLFFKANFKTQLPYDIDLSLLSDQFCSYKYAELIKEVGKNTCLK